ncbi:MAG: hypothetical protein AABX35_00130 [Nanoarchaeota archaeon]
MMIHQTHNGYYRLESVVVQPLRVRGEKQNFGLDRKFKDGQREKALEAIEKADYNGVYNPVWAASSPKPNWRINAFVYLAEPKFSGDESRERRELSYENFRQMNLKPEDKIFFRTTVEAKKFPET